MRNKTTEIISISNVSKKYQMGEYGVHALDNISLKIDENEFVSIVGPSGSGKSTLMYIIGLLDNPSTGSVKLEGKEVSKLSEKKLAYLRNSKIGFVFQQFNL